MRVTGSESANVKAGKLVPNDYAILSTRANV